MKRRTMLMLMLLGFGIASFPQVASAQSSPLIGTWKLNVEKSKSEHAGLGGRGEPQPPPAQMELEREALRCAFGEQNSCERLMQTTGCSRRQASNHRCGSGA